MGRNFTFQECLIFLLEPNPGPYNRSPLKSTWDQVASWFANMRNVLYEGLRAYHCYWQARYSERVGDAKRNPLLLSPQTATTPAAVAIGYPWPPQGC